jgi:hypothetical protein
MRRTSPCWSPTTIDRALNQQDQARDEVVDDRLQAESDANRKGARDDGQIGDIKTGIGEGDQRRQGDASVANDGIDRVDDPRIHARLLQRLLAQPALEQPSGKQKRNEEKDAEQDPGQRNTKLADLHAEQDRGEPVADIGAGEAPLQHQERNGGDHDGEGQGQLG